MLALFATAACDSDDSGRPSGGGLDTTGPDVDDGSEGEGTTGTGDGDVGTDGGSSGEGGSGSDETGDGSATGEEPDPDGTWQIVSVPTEVNLYDVDFGSIDRGWIVGASQMVLSSSDGGDTWTEETSGFFTSTVPSSQSSAHFVAPLDEFFTGDYTLLRVDALDSKVVWASAATPLEQTPFNDRQMIPERLTPLFLTTDGGETWTRMSVATNFQLWGLAGVSATAARTASIGASDHPDSDTYAIDNGRDKAGTKMTWGALRGMDFLDANTGYTVGVEIFKTTNGGASWTSVGQASDDLWAVDVVDATHGWAVGERGAVSATQDGQTWAAEPSSTSAELHSVSFASVELGWAVGDAGTIVMREGGTWTTEQSPTAVGLYGVSVAPDGAVWAVGEHGTVLERR